MAKRAIAIVGDVVDSRRDSSRGTLGRRLDRALRLAAKAGGSWRGPPARTKGVDEFSGVATDPGVLSPVLETLLIELWPARARLAVVVGDLDVGWSTKDARKMDGPAFHRAARELARAEQEGLWVTFDAGRADDASRLAEANLALIDAIASGWTPRMHEAIVGWRAGKTQDHLARAMGVSQQAVSGHLARAHARRVFDAIDAAGDWFVGAQ